MAKWSEKWFNFEPPTIIKAADIRCRHCLPQCSFTRYIAHTSKTDFEAEALNQLSDQLDLL